MDFQHENVKGAPVIWTDNLFSKKEINSMHSECDKIRELGILTTNTNGAMTEDGTASLDKKEGAYLENIYANFMVSNTLRLFLQKIHTKSFGEEMSDIHPYFRTLAFNRDTSTLLSYYENSSYYKGHIDCSFVTVIMWLYHEPKAFAGGDLIIEDELNIECTRGRVLFMPGWLMHEVTAVKLDDDVKDKGLGRYSISQFIVQR